MIDRVKIYLAIAMMLLLLSFACNVVQYFRCSPCTETKTVFKSDTVTVVKFKQAEFIYKKGAEKRQKGSTPTNAPISIPEPIKQDDSTNIYTGHDKDTSGIEVKFEHTVKGELLGSKISVVCPEKTRIITNTITTSKLIKREFFLTGSVEVGPKGYDIKPGLLFKFNSGVYGYQYSIKNKSHQLTAGIRL